MWAAVDAQAIGADASLFGVSEHVVDRLLTVQHVERTHAAEQGVDRVLTEAGAAAVVDEKHEEAESTKSGRGQQKLRRNHAVRPTVWNYDKGAEFSEFGRRWRLWKREVTIHNWETFVSQNIFQIFKCLEKAKNNCFAF